MTKSAGKTESSACYHPSIPGAGAGGEKVKANLGSEFLSHKDERTSWGYNSVAGHLLSVPEALHSLPKGTRG